MKSKWGLLAIAVMTAVAGCSNHSPTGGQEPDHIELDQTTALLAVGQTTSVSVTFRDPNGAALPDPDTASVTWTSSAPSVAAVQGTSDGATITAGAAGSATITASADGLTASIAVTVTAPALTAITVEPITPTLVISASKPLSATGSYSDGSTADVTADVAWSSSAPDVAAVAADGVITGVALGAATITATLDSLTASATAHIVAPSVGPWIPAPGFSGRPCHDAIKFSQLSDRVFVCTTATGLIKGTVNAADLSISFAPVDLGAGALAGLAVATHLANPTSVMYMAAPSGTQNNWFRSNDSVVFTNFALLNAAGTSRFIYAGRFQMGLGNVLGSWDVTASGAPQAQVLAGNFMTGTQPTPRVVGNATGTVRGIAGTATTNTYAVVLGETPTGAAATGGIFRSTDSAATWPETDTGIAAADRNQLTTLAIDPVTPAILYAGVRGGARIYKTSDAGATWTASGTGIPATARVSVVYISPQTATTVFAATDAGLYKSLDAGASWTLAGFEGRVVTGVAQSSAAGAAALILAAVDDDVGLYRAQ